MLTLKKVKEMVKAPVHTKRVPSPKMLLEDGRILLRKEFEHDSHLTLYHSGYVWFSAGKRNTVFHIAEKDLPRIFERFYRADPSRTTNGHYGLGLSVAKSLAEQQSLHIGARNTPGGGAMFYICTQ